MALGTRPPPRGCFITSAYTSASRPDASFSANVFTHLIVSSLSLGLLGSCRKNSPLPAEVPTRTIPLIVYSCMGTFPSGGWFNHSSNVEGRDFPPFVSHARNSAVWVYV